jgi:hypothetical protein
MKALTAARLRELLTYDPSTGVFRWLPRAAEDGSSLHEINRWNTRYAHTVAGTLKPDGYMRIKVDGFPYSSHRLAFLYVTGAWPQFEVDHINGDRADNRWENLRDVTANTNQQNVRGARCTSRTGVLGVSRVTKGQGYLARISLGGKRVHLGCFPTQEAAHDAYLAAKRKLHEGCTL